MVLVLQAFKKKIFFQILFFICLFNIAFSNDIETIRKVESYLNSLTYLQASFIQDDIKHSKLSEGLFYLSRPYKLRIDYTNPFKASLYTDSRTTVYYDKELEEIHSLKTADTPLKFFLKKKINFTDKGFEIISIFENDNKIEISFKENKIKENNVLILEFKKKNSSLFLSIIKLKSNEQEIQLKLLNQSTKTLNQNIFDYKKILKK